MGGGHFLSKKICRVFVCVFWGIFGKNWPDNLQNRAGPRIKKIMFILHFRLFKACNLFMKSPIFLLIGDFYVIFYVIFGDFLVGTGDPLPYCDKIPTFMSSSKAN